MAVLIIFAQKWQKPLSNAKLHPSCCSAFSLTDTYSDEFGRLDFDRSQLGSGMSNRSKVKKFVTALNKLAERTNKSTFELQELRQLAKDLQIQVSITYSTEHTVRRRICHIYHILFSGCGFRGFHRRTQWTGLPSEERPQDLSASNHMNEPSHDVFTMLLSYWLFF